MNKIGAIFALKAGVDARESMRRLAEIGCECCQVNVWDTSLYTEENAVALISAAEEFGIEISTLWAGWSGPKAWNFVDGPSTLGIVPEAYRMKRTEEVLEGARFARRLGVTRVATHVGFLPENMNDPKYRDIIAALRYIVGECKKLGVSFQLFLSLR